MARLQEFYKETVAPQLREQLNLDNAMEIPRITKITLNMGVGEALVSTLGDKGIPAPVQRVLVRPPHSRMGKATEAERHAKLVRECEEERSKSSLVGNSTVQDDKWIRGRWNCLGRVTQPIMTTCWGFPERY